MDMLLSGADGTDICRRLKQDQTTSSIPILCFRHILLQGKPAGSRGR
jgi:CheY-like chemotaxis protein